LFLEFFFFGLDRAAQKGFKQIVNYLIFVGCDPIIQDDLEQTAADLARNEKHEGVQRIVEKGKIIAPFMLINPALTLLTMIF